MFTVITGYLKEPGGTDSLIVIDFNTEADFNSVCGKKKDIIEHYIDDESGAIITIDRSTFSDMKYYTDKLIEIFVGCGSYLEEFKQIIKSYTGLSIYTILELETDYSGCGIANKLMELLIELGNCYQCYEHFSDLSIDTYGIEPLAVN
ncbi:MAG: hypothetical protein ACOCRO_07280 [Halanaerobiales bacterium]